MSPPKRKFVSLLCDENHLSFFERTIDDRVDGQKYNCQRSKVRKMMTHFSFYSSSQERQKCIVDNSAENSALLPDKSKQLFSLSITFGNNRFVKAVCNNRKKDSDKNFKKNVSDFGGGLGLISFIEPKDNYVPPLITSGDFNQEDEDLVVDLLSKDKDQTYRSTEEI